MLDISYIYDHCALQVKLFTTHNKCSTSLYVFVSGKKSHLQWKRMRETKKRVITNSFMKIPLLFNCLEQETLAQTFLSLVAVLHAEGSAEGHYLLVSLSSI